jgi:hypothetical protein
MALTNRLPCGSRSVAGRERRGRLRFALQQKQGTGRARAGTTDAAASGGVCDGIDARRFTSVHPGIGQFGSCDGSPCSVKTARDGLSTSLRFHGLEARATCGHTGLPRE